MHVAARMALQSDPLGQRQTDRVAVAMPVSMRAMGYHGSNVVVRNISELGFMADVNCAFPEGSYVRLRLPALGTMLARIAWCDGKAVGGEFINPVPPTRLNQILGMSRALS